MGRVRFFFRRHSEAHQTLASKSATFRVEFAELERRARDAGDDVSWIEPARHLLNRALGALEKAQGGATPLNEAWWCFMTAQRKAVNGLTSPELTARAQTLRRETESKLSGWRRSAAADLLDGLEAAPAGTPLADRRRMLEAAAEILDGQTQNEYRNVTALRSRVLTLTLMTAVVVASIVWRAATDPLRDSALPDFGWRTLLWVVLFGLLGGCVSAFSPLSEKIRERFLQQLVSWHLTVVRPPLGAAGALATYALVTGLDTAIVIDTRTGVVALAVVSGFSERLLVSSVARVAGAPAPPGGQA